MISPSLSQEITALHAHLCSALSDPNRIMILYSLDAQPRSVGALADELGISQSTASRHLSLLRERGLVVSNREGQSVVNTLADKRVIQALDLLRAVLTSNLKNRAAVIDTSVVDELSSHDNYTGE